jgi:hypothetical protein
MSLDNLRQINLDEIILASQGKQHYENEQNFFSELKGNKWAKNANGNVTSQALSTCLANCLFEGCAAQQMLRFHTMALLSGHLFKIHWICRCRGGDCCSGVWGWAGRKISNDIFQTWEIRKLYIEL